MACRVPETIVLAFGAAALGAPDALRLLLGRGPAADLAACVVLISAFTALFLGTVLLSMFLRKAPRAGGGARAVPAPGPAMDLFAQVTRVVSVGAALLVTACHLVASCGIKNLIVGALVVAGAAYSLPFAMPLLRFVRRGPRNATGATPAPWAGTRRVGKMTSLGVVLVSLACVVLLAITIPSWREADIGEQTCAAA
ncbi:hypothetical protein U9M48_029420 [Paspalum notatum var. saurae]|uniref:Uncharacterized protein n=1 Tax=Paspalum notatum var. saurae TaxID=547442 RepID=A0AAQ3U0X5_PASNO